MSGIRRGPPPVEEAPKTWAQVVFFPLFVIALALMAAMLLIYLFSASLVEPVDQAHEEYPQAPTSRAIPMEFPNPDHSLPIDSGPPKPEERPSGGIVIEK